jgi:tripeptidyl-peptidase I
VSISQKTRKSFPYTYNQSYRLHAAHEKRDRPHRQWVKRDRIHKDFGLPVRIGLIQNNLENGYQYLMDVSDPESPGYGKFWTSDQVHEHFAPSQGSVNAVRTWLNSSGIAHHRVVHSENKGWLAFDAYAHEVERLFSTGYFERHHLQNEEIRIGCDE